MKYIEWHSTEELYQDIMNCISEIRFIKDEQQFLEELIKNHTLDLLVGANYEMSKEVINKLSKHRKDLNPLFKKLMAHSNNLQILLDEDTIPGEMTYYKDTHSRLMFEVIAYNSKFKKIKRQVFQLIKRIMKEGKQKRLLK